jgi:hypothetical protein
MFYKFFVLQSRRKEDIEGNGDLQEDADLRRNILGI